MVVRNVNFEQIWDHPGISCYIFKDFIKINVLCLDCIFCTLQLLQLWPLSQCIENSQNSSPSSLVVTQTQTDKVVLFIIDVYSLVAYFVISYHVPKMSRAALLSCDHHGGKKAGIILWLPGETTSETTSFSLVFITNTAIFTKISSRPISNPIKTPCFVPDNRILYWRPTP